MSSLNMSAIGSFHVSARCWTAALVFWSRHAVVHCLSSPATLTLTKSGHPLQPADQLNAATEEKPLRDIYVLAGQSNCLGLGLLKELPEELATTPEHVYAWPTIGGTQWKPYSVNADNGFNIGWHFGLEASMIHELARHYQKADESFGVVKVAKIGASLQKDWAFKGWETYAHNVSAMTELRGKLMHNMGGHISLESRIDKLAEDEAEQPPPFLFSILVDSVKSAMNSPQCGGGRCRLRALIWVQGEADSKSEETATVYKENLHKFFDILRKEWESPDMFLAISPLAPFHMDRWFYMPAADQVLASQKAFVEEEGPSAAALIPTYGTNHSGDKMHYDSQSYVKLGYRTAQLLKDALHLDF